VNEPIKLISLQLHIIHLPARTDRMDLLETELMSQHINDYRIWEGITDPQGNRSKAIARSHKQIVVFAKQNNLPEVLIAEDDIHFTALGAFEYFLANKPATYNLYLASIYWGEIKADNTVRDFSGFTLYMIHKNFYDIFLALPEDRNIDRALENKGKFVVCDPFTAIQHPGFSDNTQTYCDYSDYISTRKLYRQHFHDQNLS
jgi:hypothetical protein